MSDIRNYAFIDGNYLRNAYVSSMQTFFTDVDYRNLSFGSLKEVLRASKVFYYDAIDETLPDAADREAHLDEISAFDGFHVRQGTTTGARKRKRRQKKVDVQLAVDALTHAFNKNCWHVSLVAGDLDFEPLVVALIQLGVHVHVFHQPASAAKALYRAADVSAPVSIDQFWGWSKAEYQRGHPIPSYVLGNDHRGEFMRRKGSWQGKRIELYEIETTGSHLLLVRGAAYSSSFSLTFEDATRLVAYFELRYGPVEWEEELAAQTGG